MWIGEYKILENVIHAFIWKVQNLLLLIAEWDYRVNAHVEAARNNMF